MEARRGESNSNSIEGSNFGMGMVFGIGDLGNLLHHCGLTFMAMQRCVLLGFGWLWHVRVRAIDIVLIVTTFASAFIIFIFKAICTF